MPPEMLTWTGCYEDGWGKLLVPEAYGHPAKFSRSLIRRIYQHALQQGWLARGATILDPFGGVALGAIDALANGLHWTGVELEPRFHALGLENIALWNRRFSTARGWGTARLLQGDSRNLPALVGEVAAVVSSPPWQGSLNDDTGRAVRYDGWTKNPDGSNRMARSVGESYGHTEGQLGALPPGDVDAMISSPPYSEGLGHGGTPTKNPTHAPDSGKHRVLNAMENGYGHAEGQLGNTTGDTFWQAAAQIVRQCHAVLKSGGVAIWVLKAFVRDGAIVDFPGQWQRLCEHAGLRTIQVIHASLVTETRQPSLFGGEEVKRVKRTSFFRRLHERKRPDLAIDFEVVLCMKKD